MRPREAVASPVAPRGAWESRLVVALDEQKANPGSEAAMTHWPRTSRFALNPGYAALRALGLLA